MGHQKGAYKINKTGDIEVIGQLDGSWKFIELSDNKYAIGTYNGVYIFQDENNQSKLIYKVKELNESSRILAFDKDKNLWVSHPYRGVFKIQFSQDFSEHQVVKYPSTKGFENDYDNYIFDLKGIPYLTNPNGIFYYDFTNDSFKKDSLLNVKLNNSGRIRKFISTSNDIWYIAENETGIIKQKLSSFYHDIYINRFPLHNNQFVGGFENMYPINENSQFYCSIKGVILHNNLVDVDNQNKLKTFVSEIKNSKSDSLIVAPHCINPSTLELSEKENMLQFRFRTNGKNNNEIGGYSYKLVGLDNEWSNYDRTPFKEYTNLDFGEYTFLVKSKDLNGNESIPYAIDININSPWYLSNFARFLYILLFGLFLMVIILIPRKKHEKSTAILVNKQIETEKEIKEIKEEKYKNELQFKNSELANSTLHLLQKNQTLINLKTELDKLQLIIKDSAVKKQLKQIYSLLRSDMRIEEGWDNFSFYFNQVHDDFLKKLQSQYPKLSANELKLSAYLKMNLTSKEIAPLLNISIRGVEISRYRLRKKLELDRTINLNDFLNDIAG